MLAAPASPEGGATPTPKSARQLTYDVRQAFGAIARIHRDANALTDRQQARLFAAFNVHDLTPALAKGRERSAT